MPIPCSGCGYENRLAAIVCGSCGAGLDGRATCPSCGSDNPPGQRFCNECGLPLGGARPVAAPAPPRPAAAGLPTLPSTDVRPVGSRPSVTLYAAAAAFLALAVFARMAELGSYPDGLVGAETEVRAAVSSILEGRPVGPWSEAAGGQPTGFVYWLAAWASVFGKGAVSLRMASGLLGLAAVAMFFVYCRAMFGARAALLGGMLLAVSLWHISYSRLALPVGALVLLQLAASYLLLTALKSEGRPRSFALAGAVFGAAAYTHNAFYVFAIAVGLWWARELLSGEHAVSVVLGRCAAFLAAALIVAAPYVWSLASHSDEAEGRLGSVGLSSSAEYVQQPGLMERWRFAMRRIVSTAAALPLRAEGDARRLLDPATALLAAAGLLAALWRWRRRETFHLWSTLAAAIVVVGLTRDDGMYGRLIVALPAAYAAAGYAFDGLIELLRGRVTPAVSFVAAGLILAAAGACNVRSYYDSPIGGPEDSRWTRASFGAVAGLNASARRRGGRAAPGAGPDVGTPGHTTLEVRVQPRAGRNELSVDDQGRVRVYVTAPAHDDRANDAAVRLIADRLEVAPGRVAIVGGRRSRNKLVRIEDAALRAVLSRLRSGG